MKIIFLDFDGVLNNLTTRGPHPGTDPRFDPFNISILNQIINESSAKIVITSSWRIDHTLEELRHLLGQVGVMGDIIDVTPNGAPDPIRGISNSSVRGHEIQAWLNGREDVTHFVIIDDSDDMVHLMFKLVQTDDIIGLEPRNVSQVLHHLGVQ